MNFDRFKAFVNSGKGLVLGALVIIGLTVAGIARSDEGTNLVDEIDPRWDELHQHAARTLIALREMPPAEHQAYLEREWPTLKNDVVANLAMQGRLQGGVDSVVFHFGSGKDVKADDAKLEEHVGYFTDELVAMVYPSNGGEPMKVLVRCLNGLIVVDGEESHLNLVRGWVDEPNVRFTIARGKGLTTYVDYATSISLAERFELQLVAGKAREPVTPEQARQIDTDRVPVRVLVYEGDVFDLGAMTYTPAPRR